uniref:Uncharacterized protein n=1 Tax=Oryza punctata TaxID=4537 RepID=A0A0E0KNT7_ORYPU
MAPAPPHACRLCSPSVSGLRRRASRAPPGRCSTKCASAIAVSCCWHAVKAIRSEAEGVSCTLRIILAIPERYSPTGAILQAGLLAVISIFYIHDDLALIKVRNISNSQEMMIFHLLTRYWSHWCTTKISLPLVNWMEVA